MNGALNDFFKDFDQKQITYSNSRLEANCVIIITMNGENILFATLEKLNRSDTSV